jgi:hypothetical protein
MATITVPDFLFSNFYYPQIYEALLAYTRVNAAELTSESEYESHIQLLRAFALVGHLNNTRVDIVANEQLLDSVQLRESLKQLFKLLGYKLKSATPATAEMLIKFSTVPTSDQSEYIPANTEWGTEQEDGDEIIYENVSSYPLGRGDEVDHVFVSNVTQSFSDGVVSTVTPQRFASASATFTSADVGRELVVTDSANNNAGRYVISSLVDANTIEVLSATFVSETTLKFYVVGYGTDLAGKANDEINTFAIWTDDSYPENALYISHDNILWNQLDFIVTAQSVDALGVWEYYDPTYSREYPDSVTDNGSNITFNINTFAAAGLVIVPDIQGANVKVTYSPNGKSETIISVYALGANKIITKGLLGQSVVDTDPRNYIIEAEWNPLPNLADTTSNLGQDGEVTFVLPMDTVRRWTKTTINGYEGYWLRYRAIVASATTYAILNNIKITEGDQFFAFLVAQGQTIPNEVVGSSNGQAKQEFPTLLGPVFDNSYTVQVDETGSGSWETYVEVDNFLNSSSTDRHYKTDTDEEDRLVIIFSNGVNGKIPPLGVDNIRCTYRIGGDLDGNVGSSQITGNIDGIEFVSSAGNPMPALGWTIKEGGDETDMEKAKDAGPASITNQGKAVSEGDIPRVAVEEYTTDEGASIVARAFAIEEEFGPKTVGLVVVGTGGEFLTAEQLDDLEEYYNGDRYSVPPVEGVLLLNSELTANNYEPKEVDCTYLVIGKGITPAQVQNAISAYMHTISAD